MIQGDKWAKEGIVWLPLGVWLSNLVLLVVGIYFIDKAIKDSRIFDKDVYTIWWGTLLKKIQKKSFNKRKKPYLCTLNLFFNILSEVTIMYLTSEVKKDLFTKHGKSDADTGSPESQIALFTHRINHLTGHLKTHKHDNSTRLGLLKLVGKRRRLLDYLHRVEIARYRAIIAELGIRK